MSFGSAEDFAAAWSLYIERGALPVCPARVLAPLEQLEVFLVAPGLPTREALQVEVVSLAPERAL